MIESTYAPSVTVEAAMRTDRINCDHYEKSEDIRMVTVAVAQLELDYKIDRLIDKIQLICLIISQRALSRWKTEFFFDVKLVFNKIAQCFRGRCFLIVLLDM